MLDQYTAKRIHDQLVPLLGNETLVTDPLGHILAGDNGDVQLLAEPNLVPFALGRVTLGYILPPHHLSDHERLFGFIQTIAELISAQNQPASSMTVVAQEVQISPSGDDAKTIRALLDCNLSLTKTASLLGIHRNTLTYRLDKIQQRSGLDARKFADADKLNSLVNGYEGIKPAAIHSEIASDQILASTLQHFLDCDLDINETASVLEIHRNTLTYRLDKISRLLGLDPRHFKDALSIKAGLKKSP